MGFTEEQKKAIETYGNSILVSAGAGSGKTAVLSQRVLYLLNKNIHIDEILILTFTNAASKEMKSRILDKLKKENKEEEIKRCNSAYITTFDSFSHSILKKYHYLLNISSSFSIIDDSIYEVKKIEFLDEILENEYEKKEDSFTSFINTYCEKEDKNIRTLILDLYDILSRKVDKEMIFKTYMKTHFNETFYTYLKSELEKFEKDTTNKISNLLDRLYEIDSEYAKEVDTQIQNRNDIPRVKSKLDIEGKELHTKIKELYTSIKQLDKEQEINNYKKTKNHVEVLLDITYKLDKKLERFKKEHDLYTFTDITLLACHLLDIEEVRNDLKNKFKQIMIDEYQDTNDIQEYFISKIEDNNLYMVGDMKQSIYRFRDANPKIFIGKMEEYLKNKTGTVLSLTNNFRSRYEVLDVINHIFEVLMDEESDIPYKNGHQLSFANESYKNNKTDRKLEVITFENKEAYYVASDIIKKMKSEKIYDLKEEKYRPLKYSDFAILLDRTTSFDDIKKVLEMYHIPTCMVQDEDIKDNKTLHLIYHILSLIIEEENDFSYMSILRSHLYQEEENTLYEHVKTHFQNTEIYAIIKELKSVKDTLTPYQLLDEIIQRFKIYESLEKIGNVKEEEKVIEYMYSNILSLEKLGYTNSEVITHLKHLLESGLKIKMKNDLYNGNMVTLINIHKSKGLEYPICYFMGLEKEFQNKGKLLTYDHNYGILLPIMENGRCELMLSTLSKKGEKLENLKEKLRLFYVALTRSKEQIILMYPKNGKHKNSFYGFLEKVEEYLTPYMKEGSFIDINQEEKEKIKTDILNVKEVNIKKEMEKEEESYSKKVSYLLDTKTKEKMETGNKLHTLLENFDFKNKTSDNKVIQKLLDSEIFENLKNPIFYKEYAFIDENKNGVIDLLIEDIDKIKIIDYKLKNIEDEMYLNQLLGYKKYIEKISNKKIELYLYSLLEGSIKKI